MIEIQRLGQAVGAWLDYYAVSDTQKILAESAVRFPIVGFLERQDNIKVQLEYKHSIFVTRRIDIEWEGKDGTSLGLMEIKYIRRDSMSKEEKQRIINDLIRLGMLPEDSTSAKYFLLCGDRTLFDDLFCIRKNIVMNSLSSQKIIPLSQKQSSKVNRRRKVKTHLDYWIDFNKSDKHIVACKSFVKKFIKEFAVEYYGNDNYKKMEIGWAFTTSLMYAKWSGKSFVGIWKIEQA